MANSTLMGRVGRYFVVLTIGIVFGAALFSDTQPRFLLRLGNCGPTCTKRSDVLGSAASIAFQKFPAFVPLLERENATCVAIRHPFSPHRFHYVFFPRRDIRELGTLASGDEPYVMGCLGLMQDLISTHHLSSYRMYSNGPVEQDITYLHFHLVSDQ